MESQGRSWSPPHRHLGTCLDCYTWSGPRGSAHDPPSCPFLRGSIARLEDQIAEAQKRLDSLHLTADHASHVHDFRGSLWCITCGHRPNGLKTNWGGRV